MFRKLSQIFTFFILILLIFSLLFMNLVAKEKSLANQPTSIATSRNTTLDLPTCELPCLWGLAVYEFSRDEVDEYFETYFQNDYQIDKRDEYIIYSVLLDVLSLEVIDQLGLDMEPGMHDKLQFMAYVNIGTQYLEKLYLNIPFPQFNNMDWENDFAIYQIFNKYGMPDNLWFTDRPNQRGSKTEILRLDYESKGFSLQYSVPMRYTYTSGNFERGVFLVCSNFASSSGIIDENMYFSDHIRISIGDAYLLDAADYIYSYDTLQINQISDFTLESFASLFSNDNVCMITLPRDMWQ